jgi:hypothetical protein
MDVWISWPALPTLPSPFHRACQEFSRLERIGSTRAIDGKLTFGLGSDGIRVSGLNCFSHLGIVSARLNKIFACLGFSERALHFCLHVCVLENAAVVT